MIDLETGKNKEGVSKIAKGIKDKISHTKYKNPDDVWLSRSKFDDFKKSHNNYYKKIHTNLKNNVFVKINLVPRHEKIKYQTKILEDFWLDYFDDINASYTLFNDIGS